MSVSPLLTGAPAPAPAPAAASPDAASADSGFAQVLARQQHTGMDETRQPVSPDAPAKAAAPTSDAATPDSVTQASAVTPGETPRDTAVDADALAAGEALALPAVALPLQAPVVPAADAPPSGDINADAALASSMQMADFVRELTTASRALAARGTPAADTPAPAQALPSGHDGGREGKVDLTAAAPVQPAALPGTDIRPLRAAARPGAQQISTPVAPTARTTDAALASPHDATAEPVALTDASRTPGVLAALPDGPAVRAPAGAALARLPAGSAGPAAALTPATALDNRQDPAAARLGGDAPTTRVAAVMGEPALIASPAAQGTHATLVASGLAGAAAPAAAPEPPVLTPPALAPAVAAPVGSAHWGAALGRQVVLMSTNDGGNLRHAELRLDPPDLGPLRISLNLTGEHASAVFASAHASVRAAVEAALPQLQQALADAGINLGQTSVGDQDAWRAGQEDGQGRRQGGTDDAGSDIDTQAVAEVVTRPVTRGLIDTFA